MDTTQSDASATSPTPNRSIRILVLVGGLLLVPVLAKMFLTTEQVEQAAPKFDAATTFVTGPVDSQGYIDYEAALNQRLSEGITPQTNANVAILELLGPHPERADMPSGILGRIGYRRTTRTRGLLRRSRTVSQRQP